MMQWLREATRGALWRLLFAGLLIGGGVAFANYQATVGSGTNFGSVVVAGVHYAQMMICDLTTPAQCTSVSAGGALKVDASATTQPVSAASLPLPALAATSTKQPALGTAGTPSADVLSVQGVTSMTALKVDGSGATQPVTGTVAATQSGTWTSRVVGNAGAIMDFAGQNASSPANSLLIAGQFNTSPTTITTGNASPLQLDNAGNLLVNIKAGAGAGGTALADEATFTQGTTSYTPAGCIFNSSITNLSSGQGGAFQCTNDRNLFVNLNKVAGTALGAPVAYGSAPSGNALGVNAFVTNSNTNGQATMANSALVVLASNQAAGDPCMFQAKTNQPFTTAAGTTQIISGVSAKRIYLCSLSIIVPVAVSVSLIEGSSATCGTSSTGGVIGQPLGAIGAASLGLAFPANGGLTLGNGGNTIAATATAANYVCLFQSGTAQVAGNVTYVQQ